ncbi:CLUMA_CG009955, isoform A [Clunio marinus]|uniref:CLUMA_CG009955, isoform A n=1 Tax=Clunio marinus TaxID=568069 RepID=A0A1J1IAE3_9DIPT|nr:CLUMA_CG009955, isoform A [Clunio marinus]
MTVQLIWGHWHWASCLRQVVIIHLAPDQDDMFEWFEDRFNRRFHVETFEQIVDRYEEVYLESLSSVLNNYTLVESYTRTMLVTLKLTFQSAYGNETSNSVLTMLNTILMLFWGWIYRAYVTIHLSNVIIATVNSEYKYDAFGKELEAYSKAKGLSRDLKIKIKSFYKRIFKKNYFNEDKIKLSTPIHLRKQIMMHSCSHLVEKVHLFKEIPNLILENIISCLKMEIYFPGDVIIKANTIGDAMFFIAFGTTSIYSSSGNLVGTLTDGSYFGEISLLFRKKKRTASVVACELCEIYRLNAKDFHKVIEPHSEILYRLEGISQSRMNATNTRICESTPPYYNNNKK